MPCSRTRWRHSCTVGRLTSSSTAIATLSCPARARKIIRQRSATCCGVPWEASHCSICVRSAACNLIARLVFGITKIIAIAAKSVKLFMRHYTRQGRHRARPERERSGARPQVPGRRGFHQQSFPLESCRLSDYVSVGVDPTHPWRSDRSSYRLRCHLPAGGSTEREGGETPSGTIRPLAIEATPGV